MLSFWLTEDGFSAVPAGAGGAPPDRGLLLSLNKSRQNQLRGAAPKDPGFWKQGRGEGYFANEVGRTSTYEPGHFQ